MAGEGQLSLLGRRLSRVLLLLGVCLSLIIGACSASPNLRVYRDPNGAFAFAYPNGMVSVKLSPGKGLAVLLRDLVYETENISLMIAPFDKGETIADLGGPEEVGQLVAKKIIAPEGSGRSTQLLAAEAFERQGQPYYLFEYQTNLGSQLRHEVVTVTVRHHRLYTLTASTQESRWPQVQAAFREVGRSLRVS
jgi:photosystem II oxygen-evolving enhancer protein 2